MFFADALPSLFLLLLNVDVGQAAAPKEGRKGEGEAEGVSWFSGRSFYARQQKSEAVHFQKINP